MKKNIFIIIFRLFQLLSIIPCAALIYFGSRKMGVMRYNYFIDREISEIFLTERILDLIVFIFILSIINFILKTVKYKTKTYIVALVLSIISVVTIRFELFSNKIIPIHHVVILSLIAIFLIELIILRLKK
ncbi:MAG: hypothetical protein ACRC54_01320 [Fusobacteriaceae bacterium]